MRLDQYLVEHGHFDSRSRARDAVLRGTVSIDGETVTKPSLGIRPGQSVSINDPAKGYVSRAALKLIAGLDHFGIDCTSRIALDVGASTGGFTQVLLERGAAKIHAIDVGHDQLHETLRNDHRVIAREGLNARDLTADDLGADRPDIIVSDVSFISLKLALPPALEMAAPGADALLLVKPQFEAGRERIGKGGIVDAATATRVAEELSDWLAEQPAWRVCGLTQSPIKGGDGNTEFLLAGRKNG